MDEEVAVEAQQTETEAVLSFWQAFNLNEKRAAWDKIGNEMREYKTVSINGRKKLNEMTKAFRAKPKEEQVLNVSELLKAYQEEIDQLSKRARFTESSYLTIYKALYEAPDPAPCIETLSNGITNGSAHNLEIERLKSELRQYDEEFQRLKNQDITIRRLEDQLQEYRDNQEEKVVEEAERRVRVVKDQCESQIADSREAQRSAERRLAQALESVRQAQQSADRAQSQLFEEGQRYESKISALSSEHNTLLDQNQRLSLRIAELEKAGSSQVSNAAQSTGQSQQQQLQLQRDTVEHILQQHQEQLRNLEDHQRQERFKQETLARELQQTIQRERETVLRVKAELAQCVSRVRYDQLRRELKTLRQIAFHTEEDDDEDEDDEELEGGHDYNGREEVAEEDAVEEEMRRSFDDFTPEKTRPTPIKAPSLQSNINMRSPNPTPVKKKHQKKDPKIRSNEYKNSVEALLAKRLRTIEHELAVTRSDLVEARQQESTARELAEKLRQTLEMTQQQLHKVEQDLDQRSVALEQLLLTGGGSSNDSSVAIMNPAQQQKQLADQELAALLLGDASPSPTSGNNANHSKGKVPKGMHISVKPSVSSNLTSNNSVMMMTNQSTPESLQLMVKVLQTQRDRNKDRLAFCETRLLNLQQQLDQEVAAKQQLEQDNVALYRKVKFLQSYHGSGSSSSGGGGGIGEGRLIDDPYRVSEGSVGDIESRYSALYEARLNPFAEFSSLERQRKLRELSVADRIVLNTAVAIVSNATGRTFLLFYLGAMHLLVFGTMYYLAHSVPHSSSYVQCITDPHQAQLH